MANECLSDRTPGAEKSADFERIREMDASFDKYAFPQDDQSSFSSTCIYWKRHEKDFCSALKSLSLEDALKTGSLDTDKASEADKVDEDQ